MPIYLEDRQEPAIITFSLYSKKENIHQINFFFFWKTHTHTKTHLNTPTNSHLRTVFFMSRGSNPKAPKGKKQARPQPVLTVLGPSSLTLCRVWQPGMNDENITGCRIGEREIFCF